MDPTTANRRSMHLIQEGGAPIIEWVMLCTSLEFIWQGKKLRCTASATRGRLAARRTERT